MEGSTARPLCNLLAATEAIRDNQVIDRSLPDGWKNSQFADPLRHAVMFAFKAEGAGHAAATGIENLEVPRRFFKDLALGRESHDGFMMTMSVDDRFTVDAPRAPVWPVTLQKLAQRHGLTGKAFRCLVMREQVRQLVAKHCDATWLQAHNRNPCSDVVLKGIENLPQLALGEIQHPEVVQRPAATERTGRNLYAASGRFQDVDRRFCRARIKVIVESIRPENDR